MIRHLFLLLSIFCFSAAPAWALPAVKEVVSPQGITAWLVEDETLPLISLQFSFAGGVEGDSPEKQGLATLTSLLLTQGAGPYDARTFQDKLASSSIDLSIGAGRDFIEGRLKTLRQEKDKAFKLLGLALKEPRFEDKDIARLKAQQLARVRFQLADTDWQARRALLTTVFIDHPYGLRSLGTELTLAAITRDDIQTFAKNRLTREGLLVVAVGAISPAELASALDHIFAPLPLQGQTTPIPAAQMPQEGQMICVTHEGEQTDIAFAAPMLPRQDPDWYAALIANYILGGGGFESRLMRALRTEEGLTYGISTALAPMEKASIIAGGVAVDEENAGKTVTSIKKVWHDLYEKGATSDEVEAAKAYLIGSWGVGLTSRDRIASMLLAVRQNRLDLTYIEKRKGLFENVSQADVNKVLRAWFDPARLASAAVGGQDLSCDITLPEEKE